MAEVVGLFGPPLKFDVSLPLSAIAAFAADSAALIAGMPRRPSRCCSAISARAICISTCCAATPTQEARIYAAMMELIAAHGGNVSSEHGVGSRKRAYLAMSREPADIAAMRTIKTAFDPTGYLNPAVLFD